MRLFLEILVANVLERVPTRAWMCQTNAVYIQLISLWKSDRGDVL